MFTKKFALTATFIASLLLFSSTVLVTQASAEEVSKEMKAEIKKMLDLSKKQP